ncbi:unnamed protein product [Gongylonema pulchrum]|uniref:Uncharacterized protein n=1 Tax=Gongylonema pulchrum TaxID=637853 RepID=A0A183DHG6_9BILA|nr:unnamed protein product [Gongylonema pulchrum]
MHISVHLTCSVHCFFFAGSTGLRLKDCLDYYRTNIAPAQKTSLIHPGGSVPRVFYGNEMQNGRNLPSPPSNLSCNPEMPGHLGLLHGTMPNQPISAPSSSMFNQPCGVSASAAPVAPQLTQGVNYATFGRAGCSPMHPDPLSFSGQQHQLQPGIPLPVNRQSLEIAPSQFNSVPQLPSISPHPPPISGTTPGVMSTLSQPNFSQNSLYSGTPQNFLAAPSAHPAAATTTVGAFQPSLLEAQQLPTASQFTFATKQQGQIGQQQQQPGVVSPSMSTTSAPIPALPQQQQQLSYNTSPFAPVKIHSDNAASAFLTSASSPVLAQPTILPPRIIFVSLYFF